MLDIIRERLTKAFSLFNQGRVDEAYRAYQELLYSVDMLDEAQQRMLYMGLVYVLGEQNRYLQALHYANVLVDMAATDEQRHVALHQKAMVYRLMERYWAALVVLKQEREVIAGIGNDPMALAVNLYEVGLNTLLDGKVARAADVWPEAMLHAQACGDDMTLGCVYRLKGQVLAAQGEPQDAAAAWREAHACFEQAGDVQAAREVQQMLGSLPLL